MFVYKATVRRVVDGDTLDLLIDLGFGVLHKTRVRLHGVNTPEITGVKHDSDEYRKGIAARQFVIEWVGMNQRDNFQQLIDPVVTIRSRDAKRLKAGKYGRWIVEVERDDGELLSQVLLEKGHAVAVAYG